MFKEKFPEIKSGCIPRKPQELNEGSCHKSDELEPMSQIHLAGSYTAVELLNIIRARTFQPYPGAWFMDNGEKYEVRIEIQRVIKAGED